LVLLLIVILDSVTVVKAGKKSTKKKEKSKRKKGDKKKSKELILPDGLELPDFITADDLLRDGEGSGLDPDSFMKTFFESHFPDGLPDGALMVPPVTEHNRLFDNDNEIPIDGDVVEGLLPSETSNRIPDDATRTVVSLTTKMTSSNTLTPSARPSRFTTRAVTRKTTVSTTTKTTTTTRTTTTTSTLTTITTRRTTARPTRTTTVQTTMSTKLPECQNDPPGDPSKACRQAIHRRRKMLEQQASATTGSTGMNVISSSRGEPLLESKQGTTETASTSQTSTSMSGGSSSNTSTEVPISSTDITVATAEPLTALSSTTTSTTTASMFESSTLLIIDTTSITEPRTTSQLSTKLELTVESFTTQTRPTAVQKIDTTEGPLVISIEPTTSYLSLSTESSKKFNLFDFLPSNHQQPKELHLK